MTLIDLEDGTGACGGGTPGTNASVRGTVPHGKYVGLRYTVGVPYALNHTDASGPQRRSTARRWRGHGSSAASTPRSRSAIRAAPLAPGPSTRSSCTSAARAARAIRRPARPCAARADNRAAVKLARFNPRRQQIAVDVKALVARNDITVNQADAPGACPGRPIPSARACSARSASTGARRDRQGRLAGRRARRCSGRSHDEASAGFAGGSPRGDPAPSSRHRLHRVRSSRARSTASTPHERRCRAEAATWRLAAAEGIPEAARPGRQPDERRQGGDRPAAVLRRAPIGQRHAVVLELPSPGARLQRRPRPTRRLDRASCTRATRRRWSTPPTTRR